MLLPAIGIEDLEKFYAVVDTVSSIFAQNMEFCDFVL